MDATSLLTVLMIALLLPIGFIIGYATRSLISLVRRTSQGSLSLSD